MSLLAPDPNNPKENRSPADFYTTPPQGTETLLGVESFEGSIWEPACGDGAISRVLESNGHTVVSTDLHDYGYGESGVDFLEQTELRAPNIVTNPPFTYILEFALKGLELGPEKFALLGRLTFLESQKRVLNLFQLHPPNRVWIFSRRLWCGSINHEGGWGGGIPYIWAVWDNTQTHRGTKLGWAPSL